MGVSCRIMLPGNVRVKDVANVIGAVVGFKPYREDFHENLGGWATYVDGVKLVSRGDPTYTSIEFEGRYVLYHFEVSENPGARLLNPTSTAFWGAVGKRLVDFFGGKIDYDDCDMVDWDYEVPEKSNAENCPVRGQEWYDFQQRILDIKPLTKQELESIKGTAYPWAQDKKTNKYTFDKQGFMTREAIAKAA